MSTEEGPEGQWDEEAMTPEQQAINEREWSNRDNWSWFGYSSAKDTRLFVPKPNPLLGGTVNTAHRAGKLLLAGLVFIVLLPWAIMLTVLWAHSALGL